MAVAQAGAAGFGNRLPVRMKMERGVRRVQRIEVGLVEAKGLFQRGPYLGVFGVGIELGQGFHQVEMRIGALEPGNLDNGIGFPLGKRGPVRLEMFHPPPAEGIE